MRIADFVLRRGHLSDDALAEAWYSGMHPAHLDQCDLCAERAVSVGRWLDDTRQLGIGEADAAFPAERLAAQEHQILRRLEQLDRPSKLLAFPGAAPTPAIVPPARQVSPRWIAAAAAAGLVLGVIGGRLSVWQPAAATARVQAPAAITRPEPATAAAPAPVPSPTDDFLMEGEIAAPTVSSLRALDTLTPQVTVARVSDPRR